MQLSNSDTISANEAKRSSGRNRAFYLISIPSLLLMIASIWWSALYPWLEHPLIPEVDLTTCPPISANKKRLWAYWHSGPESLPIFMKENMRMWLVLNPDWELRILHFNDTESPCHVYNFLNKTMLPKDFDQLMKQKQADASKIAVMRLYGGISLDTSVILFEPLQLNFWRHVDLPEDHPDKKAFVSYYKAENSLPDTHNGMEIWMMVCAENEPIMAKWHDLYLKIYEEGPKPFVKNFETGEQNKLFQGVNFDPISEFWLDYGLSTAILRAVLQLDPAINERYEKKSLFIHSPFTSQRVDELAYAQPAKTYSYLFEAKKVSWYNIKRMSENKNPLVKLIKHANYATDELYDQWKSLPSNLGINHLVILERAKRWYKERVWDFDNWSFLRVSSPDQITIDDIKQK